MGNSNSCVQLSLRWFQIRPNQIIIWGLTCLAAKFKIWVIYIIIDITLLIGNQLIITTICCVLNRRVVWLKLVRLFLWDWNLSTFHALFDNLILSYIINALLNLFKLRNILILVWWIQNLSACISLSFAYCLQPLLIPVAFLCMLLPGFLWESTLNCS